MIENRLYIKLLSLNRMALRLSSLSNAMSRWPNYSARNSETLGYPGDSLFGLGQQGGEGELHAGSISGLSSIFTSLQGSIQKLSASLGGFTAGQKTHTSKEKIRETSVFGTYDKVSVQDIRMTEKFSSATVNNIPGVRLASSGGIAWKLLQAGSQSRIREKNTISNVSTSVKEKSATGTDRESIVHFREFTEALSLNHSGKKKLLDTEVLKRIQIPERQQAEKASYTIHQNFGDIVVHPASMDVSMQQLKVKIQDILKEVRDSIY